MAVRKVLAFGRWSVGAGLCPSPTHRLSIAYASYVRADVGIRPYTPSIAALSVGRGDITPPPP